MDHKNELRGCLGEAESQSKSFVRKLCHKADKATEAQPRYEIDTISSSIISRDPRDNSLNSFLKASRAGRNLKARSYTGRDLWN